MPTRPSQYSVAKLDLDLRDLFKDIFPVAMRFIVSILKG